MDHRLGYPAVIDHVEYAIDPDHIGTDIRNSRSDWRVFTVERESARFRKMLATHTPENDAKETSKHDKANPQPAQKPRDEPYRPEFDFQYVDRKGHLSDTVIPKRPAPSTFKDREQAAFEAWLISAEPSGDAESVHDQWRKSLERLEFLEQEEGPAAESIITPLAPSAGVVADAPTEWQSAPPSERGWFNALDKYDRAHEIDFFARYWDGSAWGGGVAQSTDVNTKIEAAGLKAFPRGLGIDVDIRWRGSRLVGADWPEPQA